MEQIVRQILEIEEKAHAITEEAENMRSHFEEQLSDEVSTMKGSLLERAEKRLQVVRETEEAAKEEQIAALALHGEEERTALAKHFEQNRDGWIKAITNAVIGG